VIDLLQPNIPEDPKKYWNEMEGEKLLKRVQNKTKKKKK